MSIEPRRVPVAQVRIGHRELLSTFREFADPLPTADPSGLTDLRAVVAFLRQSLLPFARWEEDHWTGCIEVAEDTAFEHAFLTAEIDRLATAVQELERTAPMRGAPTLEQIHRHLYRIEAVLELHVQKAEDREALFSSGQPRC